MTNRPTPAGDDGGLTSWRIRYN